MTADETHRMRVEDVAGLPVYVDDRMPPNVIACSTADGTEIVKVLPNADPVALAIGRRKLEKQKGDAKRMRREQRDR